MGEYKEEYMKEAVREAQTGIRSGHGGPFGCVIVRNGQIIGRGHNRVVVNHDSTCHGEMMAIRDACAKEGSFDLSGSELYTTGEPCPMCFGAILWANIGKVYYGCSVEDTRKIGFRDSAFFDFEHDSERKAAFMTQAGEQGCKELYDEYVSIEDKTNY